MSTQTEAHDILSLASGDALKAYTLVQDQLSVLVLRTQVLLSLSGIVVTVTGFSGRTIAQTSEVARWLIASGIVVVLLSAATAIGGVLRLRWLTQALDGGAMNETTLMRMLEDRNAKARFLNVALVLFVVGFSCYCIAIALMLIAS